MKRTLKWGIAILLIILLAVAYIAISSNRDATEISMTVEYETLRQIVSSSGKVVPERTVEIQSQVSGVIESVFISEGDKVESGEVLLMLDDENAKNAVASAELRLLVAENAFENIHSSGAAIARETLKQAQIALEDQKTVVEDYEYLYENGALERQALENAKSRYETLLSQFNSASANLRSLQKNGAAYDAALLQIELADAELESARLALDRHAIRSATQGIVTNLFKEEGEILQQGEVIAELAVNPGLFVLLDVDESSIGAIALGQSATVWPVGSDGAGTPARVISIASKVDEDSGTVEVRLELDQGNEEFIQDMSIRAEILILNLEDAILLPAKYLTGDNPPTVLIRKGDEVVSRVVTIEPVDLTNYLVLDGLEAGDEVIYREQ